MQFPFKQSTNQDYYFSQQDIRERNQLDLLDIVLEQVFEYRKNIEKIILNNHIKNTVIILGPSEGGKTTFFKYLLGTQLEIKTKYGIAYLEANDLSTKIGNTSYAKSTTPNYWLDFERKTIYFDFPSFDDTQDYPQDVKYFMIINLIVELSTNIKFVFVFSHTQVYSGRAETLRTAVDLIAKMFGRNLNKFLSSSCAVITKVFNNEDINELQWVRFDNDDSNDIYHYYFDSEKIKIFYSPSHPEVNQDSGSYTKKYREEYFEFLKKIEALDKIDINLPISYKSKSYLEEYKREFNQEITNKIINNLVDEYSKRLDQEVIDVSNKKFSETKLKRMNKKLESGINQFKKMFNCEYFDEFIKNIENFEKASSIKFDKEFLMTNSNRIKSFSSRLSNPFAIIRIDCLKKNLFEIINRRTKYLVEPIISEHEEIKEKIVIRKEEGVYQGMESSVLPGYDNEVRQDMNVYVDHKRMIIKYTYTLTNLKKIEFNFEGKWTETSPYKEKIENTKQTSLVANDTGKVIKVVTLSILTGIGAGVTAAGVAGAIAVTAPIAAPIGAVAYAATGFSTSVHLVKNLKDF